jgi:hypothetical protein
MSAGDTPAVSIDVDIDGDGTVIEVTGTREAALVVHSASGEEIYLPPENFEDEPDGGASATSPDEGGSPADSPYEAADDVSPYGGSDAEGRGSGARPVGVEPTPEGFRVVHPEPVRDVRVLR